MTNLYADENFPLPVVLVLRQLGHDVLTALEARQANLRISDPRVLAFATAAVRVVLTMNRHDFIRLHRQLPDHAGIVVCTADPDAFAQAYRVAEAIAAVGPLVGKLVRVNRPA